MQATKQLRNGLEHTLDALETLSHTKGYETAVEGIEELSDIKHNAGDTVAAEILRWAAKELRGENA